MEQRIKLKRRTDRQAKDEEQWNALSTLAAIDAIEKDYHSSQVNYSSKKGSLVVIGSGIKCVSQFSLEAISHLKNADKVLYCVADPATEHFICDLCPDALDLYVLYNDGKPRYETYVQMAEVTLYYARQGLNTVLVFYGHPGVFVMPSHRAIKIAQQQGIQATMLPAISALDCLTADLGIDPSYPGMMTLEATDLLLRNRALLTDMHIILWQVGCVGDLGFTRTGYMNQHLPVLIKHLQGIYGNDYVITHYVGAQYPMCNPTIVKLPLNKIHEPEIAKTITGISTFYIPPKDPKDVVATSATRLSLVPKVGKAPRVRPYAQCGPQEKKAIYDLFQWTVPVDYGHYTQNKVGEYIGSLAQDVSLLKMHKKTPVQTMKKASLSSKEISTLLTAYPGPIRMLMKSDADSIATKATIRLMIDPKFASAYYDTMKKYQNNPNGETCINNWLVEQGYNTKMIDIVTVFKQLQQTRLLPWSGIYTTTSSITLTIQGQSPPSSGKIWVNNTQINKFTFANQTLTWSSTDGNSSSASLVFTDGGSGKFSFTGKYWISTNQMPLANNISGQNTSTKSSLSNWVGSYDTKIDSKQRPTTTGGGNKILEISIARDDSTYTITFEGKEISHYKFGENNVLSWSDHSEVGNTSNAEIAFIIENPGTLKVRRKFSGKYWLKGSSRPTVDNFSGEINVNDVKPYLGIYKSFIKDSQEKMKYGPQFILCQGSRNTISLTIGTTVIKSPTYSNSCISWSSKSSGSGSITFHIDPNTHTAAFYGKTWTSSTVPSKYNFFGSIDSTYLKEWAGVYTTYTQFDSTWSPGAQLVLNSATAPKDIQVTYGGTAIKSPVFNNPVLSWCKSDGNTTDASITFYYTKGSTVPLAYGKISSTKKQPENYNFSGKLDTQYIQSWSGNYTSYLKDRNGKYTIDGPQIVISGGLTQSDTTASINGKIINNFQYTKESKRLQWSDVDNDTSGDVTLFSTNDKPSSSSNGRSFSGSYWKKGTPKPSDPNFAGKCPCNNESQGSQQEGAWTLRNFINMVQFALIMVSVMQALRVLWPALKSGNLTEIKAALQKLKGVLEKGNQILEENEAMNPEQIRILPELPQPSIDPPSNVNSVENNVEIDVEIGVENNVELGVTNSVENNVETNVDNNTNLNVESNVDDNTVVEDNVVEPADVVSELVMAASLKSKDDDHPSVPPQNYQVEMTDDPSIQFVTVGVIDSTLSKVSHHTVASKTHTHKKATVPHHGPVFNDVPMFVDNTVVVDIPGLPSPDPVITADVVVDAYTVEGGNYSATTSTAQMKSSHTAAKCKGKEVEQVNVETTTIADFVVEIGGIVVNAVVDEN